MDGEAGWWTTSGNIGLPPLARAMGVGRQQHLRKSCQLSRTEFPVETNQPLPVQSEISFNECEMNGHELSKCSPSNNISTCGDSQLLNSVPRDSFYFSEEEESNGKGANTFQSEVIRGKF